MWKKAIATFLLLCSALSAEEAQKKAAVEKPQIEHTLSIVKPDAVANNQIGEILEYLENGGLQVIGSKMIQLTPEQAKAFYSVHKDKAFFNDLIAFMTSGPVVVQVLEGEDAVAINRQIMGSTNPTEASPGTIRSDFGTDIQRNAVHGSDSPKTAEKEINFFFKPNELFPKKNP